MNKFDLQKRTKVFAIEVIKYCQTLAYSPEVNIIKRQLIRSATSVGANYRSACMGKSKNDFIAKLNIVLEEADESVYWLELFEELSVGNKLEMEKLKKEANEITAIIFASIKTSKLSKV